MEREQILKTELSQEQVKAITEELKWHFYDKIATNVRGEVSRQVQDRISEYELKQKNRKLATSLTVVSSVLGVLLACAGWRMLRWILG